MKTIKLFFLAVIATSVTFVSSAQKAKIETFRVNGNCGMCEAKIEKAAKAAGATYAEWDMDKKEIKVKYSVAGTNLAKIQKSIADAGYDNAGAKTTDELYNKLHSCCKYDRAASDHDSRAAMDCCKDGTCTAEGHNGKDCCKKDGEAKLDCCKDGKCTKEGHTDKDCCKKS